MCRGGWTHHAVWYSTVPFTVDAGADWSGFLGHACLVEAERRGSFMDVSGPEGDANRLLIFPTNLGLQFMA